MSEKPVYTSSRLDFYPITVADFEELGVILQDEEVMYSWPHPFSDEEVESFIQECTRRYKDDGFSYYKAVIRQNGRVAGLIGPLMDNANGSEVYGVAYILDKHYWGLGIAKEGVIASINHLFTVTDAAEVVAQIRPENIASIRLATRIGFVEIDRYDRKLQGENVPQVLFELKKADWKFAE